MTTAAARASRPPEESQQALWPSDTHVDFERGVNAAVNRFARGNGRFCRQPAPNRNFAASRLSFHRHALPASIRNLPQIFPNVSGDSGESPFGFPAAVQTKATARSLIRRMQLPDRMGSRLVVMAYLQSHFRHMLPMGLFRFLCSSRSVFQFFLYSPGFEYCPQFSTMDRK